MLKRWWILKHDPVRVVRMPGAYPVSGVGPKADLQLVEREDYDTLRAENEELHQRIQALRSTLEELHYRAYGEKESA